MSSVYFYYNLSSFKCVALKVVHLPAILRKERFFLRLAPYLSKFQSAAIQVLFDGGRKGRKVTGAMESSECAFPCGPSCPGLIYDTKTSGAAAVVEFNSITW